MPRFIPARRLLAGAMTMALAAPALPAAAAPLDAAAARGAIDAQLDRIYPALDALYKDIHQHPEVGFQETRTAALLAARMRQIGFTVTEHVGQTGVVAVYRNGDGPVVMVRTELDGLPLEEKTGLPYASHYQQTIDGKLTPTDHACGHDSHMAWWVGTAQTLLAMKDKWHGTLVFIGQPAEEKIGGAKAMLADGLFTRFPKPDYAFAAHVTPDVAGHVVVKQGTVSSASDSVIVTFHGQGAHGSMPDKSIDPIVMGAHFVDDVQTVISRQKDPQKFGVITVGAFNAGFAPNIIPDTAVLKLTLRSYDADVRKLLLDGVDTTARAVATMAHADAPDVAHTEGTASVINDPALAARLAGVLQSALGDGHVALVPATMPGGTASEDYSEFVNAGVPQSVFFAVGGSDPAMLARLKSEGKPVPVNHSPFFAPQPEPAIRTGVETLVLAVLGVAGN
jgi:hippurate hydrolase